MKKIITSLFFAALFFLSTANIYAQDQEDSVAERIGDPDETESLSDTIVNRNTFETVDSLQSYKTDRDFAYMKFLDSLLRTRKDLTVDTFSVNYSSSQGSKNIPDRQNKPVKVPQVNIFSQPVVKIILWILAVLLIGFIIRKLFIGDQFFRRNTTLEKQTGVKEEEDLSDPSGYDALIANAIAGKNYRLAIRYTYLQTLKKLSVNGLLQFTADKTNYQYVNELRGKPYQNDFAALTLNYEYVWYGNFDIAETLYLRLAADYKIFNQKTQRL